MIAYFFVPQLFCERDVYNADFEENKPLSRYTCMHGGQAKVIPGSFLPIHPIFSFDVARVIVLSK